MKTQTLLLTAILAFVPRLAGAVDSDEGPGEEDPAPAPGPSGPDVPPGPQPTWTKTLNNSNCFPTCASSWGAGFSIGGRLAATPRSSVVPRDKLEGWGELDTYAKMNGSRYSLFRVRVAGVTEAKLRTDMGLTAYVFGSAIFTQPFVAISGSSTFMNVGQSWTKTFFDRSVTVGVGPVPVTFRARASGSLGASLTGRITNVGFEVGAGPSGKASFFGSAAVGGAYCVEYVGCIGATAGLAVDLTLIEASAPINYNIWWSLVNMGYGAQLNYGLNSSLNLKTLSGVLKVVASACLVGCLDWENPLITFTGSTSSYPLLAINGKHCLVGDCNTVTGFGP